MVAVRSRFRAMLDAANGDVRTEISERQQFEAECRKEFAALWDAVKAISDEVGSRRVGTVTPANPTPSSDRFEVIYNFQAKGFPSVPITFRFETNTGPSRVTMVIGVSWADESTAKSFSVDEIDRAIAHLLSFGAGYFKSNKRSKRSPDKRSEIRG